MSGFVHNRTTSYFSYDKLYHDSFAFPICFFIRLKAVHFAYVTILVKLVSHGVQLKKNPRCACVNI